MSDDFERISPLETLAMPGIYGANTNEPGVELSERLPVSLVQVSAWPDSIEMCLERVKTATGLSLSPQVSAREGDVLGMPVGPGKWLIESEDEHLETELRKIMPSAQGSVTGLSHSRTIISLSGEKCRWVLASGMALDFADDAFPKDAVKLTHHHDVGVIVHRIDADEFELYVATSMARSFWHWITTAAAEVGYRVS